MIAIALSLPPTFATFYLQGRLPIAGSDLLHASGKISIDSSQGSGGNNFSIAFYDQTNPSKGGNALRINVVQGGGVQLWLRLEIGKNLISPIATGLVDGDYLWTNSLNWSPGEVPFGNAG